MSNEFFDDRGYLHSRPGERNAENAVMFTMMYHEFNPDPHIKRKLMHFIHECGTEKRQTMYKLSLDNLNALCLAKERGIICKGELLIAMDKTDFKMWLRPDNFYTWSKAIGYKLLPALAFPFAALMMLYSSWKKEDKKPRGEGKDRTYIKEPATNGKNQVWLRLRAHPCLLLEKACTYLIGRNFGSIKGSFKKYFKAEGQPLTTFSPGRYEFREIK